MERIDYSTNDDKVLVSKANNLRETIEKVLGGDEIYKLLGVMTKKMVYDRGVKNVTPKIKPAKTIKTDLSLDELTYSQKGFFGNLNNLKEISYLDRFNNKFVVLPDVKDESAFILIMASKTLDSLSRIVVEKTGVLFRRYTDEEKQKYKEQLELEEAKNLGYTPDDDIEDLYADSDF